MNSEMISERNKEFIVEFIVEFIFCFYKKKNETDDADKRFLFSLESYYYYCLLID
jgi:hypothetical protein